MATETERPLHADAARNAERILRTARAVFADLVPDDLPRLMAMLTSTLWTMDPGTDGWRRYLALMFEGLTPAAAKPLPAPVTLRKEPRPGNWSL